MSERLWCFGKYIPGLIISRGCEVCVDSVQCQQESLPKCFADYISEKQMLRECDDCPLQLECIAKSSQAEAAPPSELPTSGTHTDQPAPAQERPHGDSRTGCGDPPITYDIRDVTSHIVEWADEIIPGRLPEAAFEKLLEEIEEWSKRPADGHEAADVMILILDVCHLAGIDIAKAVHWKMRINRGREWRFDERGIIQHVKD